MRVERFRVDIFQDARWILEISKSSPKLTRFQTPSLPESLDHAQEATRNIFQCHR